MNDQELMRMLDRLSQAGYAYAMLGENCQVSTNGSVEDRLLLLTTFAFDTACCAKLAGDERFRRLCERISVKVLTELHVFEPSKYLHPKDVDLDRQYQEITKELKASSAASFNVSDGQNRLNGPWSLN